MQQIFNSGVRINEVYPYCRFSIGVGGSIAQITQWACAGLSALYIVIIKIYNPHFSPTI